MNLQTEMVNISQSCFYKNSRAYLNTKFQKRRGNCGPTPVKSRATLYIYYEEMNKQRFELGGILLL